MKKQSGFTLIELMVVMAIIAILATAGLTAYSNYLKKARDSARLQTARQLMTMVENLSGGGSPPTPAALLAFLIAENFAPVDGSGKLKIDPLDGATSCYERYSETYTMECIFTYGTISDGTYYISYPVEHPDNLINYWITPQANSVNNGNYSSGNIIGTNPHIIESNFLPYDTTSWHWSQSILSTTALYPSMPTFEEAIISSNVSGL